MLEKLNRVSSIADFVKVFNPKGFSLRKEYIDVKKKTKDKSYNRKGMFSIINHALQYKSLLKFGNWS